MWHYASTRAYNVVGEVKTWDIVKVKLKINGPCGTDRYENAQEQTTGRRKIQSNYITEYEKRAYKCEFSAYIKLCEQYTVQQTTLNLTMFEYAFLVRIPKKFNILNDLALI